MYSNITNTLTELICKKYIFFGRTENLFFKLCYLCFSLAETITFRYLK